MNFGRGEVAERLQCISDLGFSYLCILRLVTRLYQRGHKREEK